MADIEFITDASDEAIAAWLQQRLEAALMQRDGPVAVCLPGGSTPGPILKLLAEAPLDWQRITLWPGDDRVVPADHPASNGGQLRSLLGATGAQVVALDRMEAVPHFALTLLGMGADGHIASLFPNTDPDPRDPQAIRRLTPDPLPPEAPFDRITLTIPALLESEALAFVIHGAEKRRVFEAAMAGESDLPVARLLRTATQKVTCFA